MTIWLAMATWLPIALLTGMDTLGQSMPGSCQWVAKNSSNGRGFCARSWPRKTEASHFECPTAGTAPAQTCRSRAVSVITVAATLAYRQLRSRNAPVGLLAVEPIQNQWKLIRPHFQLDRGFRTVPEYSQEYSRSTSPTDNSNSQWIQCKLFRGNSAKAMKPTKLKYAPDIDCYFHSLEMFLCNPAVTRAPSTLVRT